MHHVFRTILGIAFVASCVTPCRADDPKAAEKKPAAKTKSVAAGDIQLTVPETWKKIEASQLRVAQFEVPPTGDEKESGEYVVFFSGKRGMGSVEDNIERWVKQFEPEGRKAKVVTGESKLGKYTLVDLGGTYNKSIGPPIAGNKKKLAGWRVINVIVETESGPYYLKMDGPAKLIAAVEDELRASFGAKKETEKEQAKGN